MSSNYEYVAKKKTKWILTTFIVVWSLFCVAMITVLFVGFYQNPERIGDLIWLLFVLLFALGIAFSYVRWQLYGVEKLIVTKTHIEFHKLGSFFNSKFQISYSELDGISFFSSKNTLPILKFWGITGGQVKIEFLGRRKMFGQDLSALEAKKIVKVLHNELTIRGWNN